MTELNESNFDMETKTGLVLVDFYTKTCGPCRMLAPILEQVKDIKVVKADCHQNVDKSRQYNVSGVPCLVFLKDGAEVDRMIGLQKLNVLQAKVDGLK